ncbi:hypothetical protein [Ancylobacter mangrovi]|uniref:hypothetical protein n=1 Tax=Ancylobacter mangrovi TaxID=2972472 RepID=UPI002161C4AA|nr:hypothetical protein [Ancylobacter mangrovi]MCS0503747.1 hypothetical protein [Ancylobacter mangrovi]
MRVIERFFFLLASFLAVLPALTVWSPAPAEAQDQPVAAAQPPLVLLLDGLGVYVETDYVGVSALARPLRQQGFRTRTDTHLMNKTRGIVPDIIIGHSMGGDTALRYARKLVASGQPAPLVITIDAAPAPPSCPVARCINIHGPGFPNVRGALNIDAWASGAKFVAHAQLPTHPAVEAIILNRTSDFMRQREARAVPTPPTAPAEAEQGAPAASSSSSAPAASTAPAKPQWTAPGWSAPNWSFPGMNLNGG